MPLFGSKKETTAAPPPVVEKKGMFGTKKTTTTTTAAPPVQQNSPTRRSGMFSRRRSSSPDISPQRSPNKLTHGSGSLLQRKHEDPSIGAARERVMRAETAEREADRALVAARAAVREARAEVLRLEHEAAEEVCLPSKAIPFTSKLTTTKQARLAKIKQSQAASLSKRGKMLGRHDHH